MLGEIITPDIDTELRRRGIYMEVAVTPPRLPEAPEEPVTVIPGPPPIYREPLFPRVPPYISPAIEPERELWLPGGPPTRFGEGKLSKSALIAGGVILAAIIIFTAKPAPGKPKGKKKPVLRRRTTREEFRPAEMEAM